MKLSFIVAIFFVPSVLLTNFLALTFSDFIYKDFFKSPEDLHYALNVTNHIKFGQKLNEEYFSGQAVLHMEDVKLLYDTVKAVNAIVLFIFFSSVIYLIYKKNFRLIRYGLISGVILSTLSILLVFILSLLDFNLFFLAFHKLIFRNNLWLFDPWDKIVMLFTREFFIHFITKMTTNILITLLLTVTITKFIPNDSKNG